MKLIVGLGNPEPKYDQTRHNIGFWVLDRIVAELGLQWDYQKKIDGDVARMDGLVFLKPMTYMNCSGKSVGAAKNFYKANDVVVVSDDLSLNLGRVRIRRGGSSGGHNGLKDIMRVHGEDFWRYKVGVGPQPDRIPAENFVLAQIREGDLEDFRYVANMVADRLIADLKNENFAEETINFEI